MQDTQRLPRLRHITWSHRLRALEQGLEGCHSVTYLDGLHVHLIEIHGACVWELLKRNDEAQYQVALINIYI